MKIIPSCEKCLYEKQEKVALRIDDEKKRAEFLEEIRGILRNREEEDCSPYMVSLFNEVQRKYGLSAAVFPREKYNRMIMDLEDQIEERITEAEDPLATALLYARIGNYIDFGAMNTVDDDVLMSLLEEAEQQPLDAEVYAKFCQECESGKTFLLLCDNCGEIVLDKLLIRQMKRQFPHLDITVMVRGKEVLNDATMEDAEICGMTKEAKVITNGTAISGTVYSKLPAEAKAIYDQADVILAKGQGNYEGLFGTTKAIYYTFLCKCDLFVSRFQVPRLTGMFVKQ